MQNKVLISTKCIKKVYPSDIGAIKLLKNLVSTMDLRAVSRKDVFNIVGSASEFNRGKIKVSYYNVVDVEDKLKQVESRMQIYSLTDEKRLAIKRIREVIAIIKKEKEEAQNVS